MQRQAFGLRLTQCLLSCLAPPFPFSALFGDTRRGLRRFCVLEGSLLGRIKVAEEVVLPIAPNPGIVGLEAPLATSVLGH